MPIIWVQCIDGNVYCTSAVPAWALTTTTGTAVTLNIWNTATNTTSSTVYWPMAHSAFDSPHDHYRQAVLQQQAMQYMAAQQAAQQTMPGGVYYAAAAHGALQQLQAPPPTPEQLAERERRMREDRERTRQALRNRESATRRARELLLEHLTPEQRETFIRHSWFVVEGGLSKTRYRIHTDRGPAGNIVELDAAGLQVAQLCGHIRTTRVPEHDEFLAQMIMLQADEAGYRRIANRSPLR